MEDTTQTGGAASVSTTETQSDQTKTSNVIAGSPADTVAREDHERALADLHKYKKEAAKYKESLEADKVNRMKEQNQWKETAQHWETKAKQMESESEQVKTSYLNEKKYNALHAAASKFNLRPEAISDLESLDLSEIQIETTSTGKINVLGADKFAERLKTLKPHWFQDKSAPNVNTSTQRVHDQSATVTPQMALDAQKKGDVAEYNRLVKQLQMQNRKH